MILTKDSNDNWSTVAAGAGTWKGTKAAWEAGISGGTIPANTVGLITDDAENFDVVDTVADANMHAVTSNAVYDKLNNFITITTELINSNEFAQNPNYPQRYDITLAPTVTPSGYTKCIAAVLGVAWFSSNVYVPLEVYDRIKYVYNDQFQFAVCTPDMANIQNTQFRVSYIWTK